MHHEGGAKTFRQAASLKIPPVTTGDKIGEHAIPELSFGWVRSGIEASSIGNRRFTPD
ncbi:hypothetical protein [Methylobacterium mesophilicum]|uniref:hypothetical protein n=1 Tax=Methylobacterium mesophilicum TaxID=39956 RepID=UPI0002C5F799|nr:hypothetical protein [Methylobacterium mesophilicum]